MSNCFRFKGDGCQVTALFGTISRVNHSCEPNVRMQLEVGLGRLEAVRRIEVQEEILLSYGGWDTAFLARAPQDRQEYLLGNWGFQCRCTRCEKELAG
ncbi:unnamed protein product [Effrenium voratum]|nr:unnamed protein product [Effrenium voratum]